ncbi:MAG: CHAP domain-containing protein [Solirubrobacterales bacterium]
MSRCGSAAVLLAMVALLAAPSAVQAGGSGISLRANITEGDNSVGVRVSLGGYPNEWCQPTIHKDGRTARPPGVRTSRNGGAVWSWFIPRNVSAGYWRFSVVCTGGRRKHTAKLRFLADRGAGRSSRGLWVKMVHRSVDQPPAKNGNGGGGGVLYPAGQSTWWVARHRTDLPFFPGRAGNAMNWAKSAEARGFPVGTAPKTEAVAVFQPGQYGAGRFGHVALVVAVHGSRIRISEAGLEVPGKVDERTIDSRGLRFIYKKGNPAPSLSAALTSPVDDERVHGVVTVSAQSNAPALRFAVYSYSDPSDPETGAWQVIGEDSTPADGFSAEWETASIPNQGGSGATVVVVAVVLGPDGTPTGAESKVTVAVANSRSGGGQTYFPYYVVGTCAEDECGLTARSGPGSKFTPKGEKHDGDEVDVVCQAVGETFTSHFGGSSSVWDHLTNGSWVSDYYVDTPERGALSPPIPSCP